MDIANIDSGEFEARIKTEIRSRRNFVLLIEHGSLDHIAADDDWLHREIALALSAIKPDRTIVPLIFDDLVIADHSLPLDVASLARYNHIPMDSRYFDAAMALLCEKFLKPDPSTPVEGARSRPPIDSRFAQLTYTSFERDGQHSRWQIKEVVGELSAEEMELLVRGISLKLEQYPKGVLSRGQIEALPRRLVYGPLFLNGAVAYWHTVPAGNDAYGRPGNVFAHILLDRDPAAIELLRRPSDLIDSPAWLRPFGVSEVRAAVIDDISVPVWDGDRSIRAAVLAFLAWASQYRAGTLAALLDGLVAAMRGKLTVVLGTDNADHARLWIASACHLMSPGTSRELYWSTSERADRIADARLAGLHLAVVPLADLRVIGRERLAHFLLVSDEDDAVTLGDLYTDTHHYTRFGSQIPVTPWSVIVAAVLKDRDVAARALKLQDEVAAVVGDRHLECAWPLAITAIGMPVELHELASVAVLALTTRPPAGLASGSRLDRLRTLMRRQHTPRT